MTARIAIKWAASEPIPAPVEPGLSAEARMFAANLDCGRPNRELLRRILSVQTADEVEVVRRA